MGMKERLKYFILALFLGMICKIYDDLVDNNLYKNFNISNKNKPYVDDILKGFFIIGFSIIKNPFKISSTYGLFLFDILKFLYKLLSTKSSYILHIIPKNNARIKYFNLSFIPM